MDRTAIIKVYFDLVQAGRRKIEDVPDTVRSEVEAMLGADPDD